MVFSLMMVVLGSQASVVTTNKGLLSFHFTVDHLWSLDILKSGKK